MKKWNLAKYRIASQIAFFVIANLGFLIGMTGLIYPFFYCYASPGACASCPLGIIEHAVVGGSVAIGLIIYVIIFFALIGMVFGRAACGWACPIGALQDAIRKGTGKVQKKIESGTMKKLPRWAAGKMKYVKYAALAYVVVGAVFLSLPTFTDLCPIGVLTGTFPQMILNPGSFIPATFFAIGMVIFGLFIVLVALVGRGWCRWLCPIGALFASTNKVSMLKIELDNDKCAMCGACEKACPMGIKLPEDLKRNPECILCGRCVEACKFDALRM